MQKGRILQIGAPETVYRRPASRDVAAFFGTPNLIEAKVAACRPADDGYVVSIEGGECRADQAFSPGDSILVIVRPEDVTFAANGVAAAPGQLAWAGKVVDGVFRGPRRSLSIETATLRFNVDCPATRAAAVGDAVTLLVDSGNAWALRP
jgi:iron(III) transport system ATP-binding protein